MSLVFDLKARLSEMRITPKKAFGQNFLVSQTVIDKIVSEALATEASEIVEVGPGLGALTEPLIASGRALRVIELDRELIEYWRSRQLNVIDADALKYDWELLKLRAPALLVSNLPYQISTSLVVERCFGPLNLQKMILMFQKEVAQRLMAEPRTKDYGLLSVLAQVHFKMKRLVDASPRDFHPPPKIASRVLVFERLPDPGLGRGFLTFVKGAFAFRRKFLLKNLGAVVDKARMSRAESVWAEMGLSVKVRAEELSPEQFVELYRRLLKE